MSYLNTGTKRVVVEPPTDLSPHATTPLEEYDHNCIFPICEMKSEKVLVTPFIPSLHAQLYLDGTKQDEYGIFRWVPWGPFADLPEMLRFCEKMRADKSVAFFAVFDTTQQEPRFAGVLKLYQCNINTLSAEIGNVLVLPSFRRTHVLTHALSLFITWAFTIPVSPSPSALLQHQPGLGLRRLQWTASPANVPSIRAAVRMGFKEEGILRNQWEWPQGKDGTSYDRTGELPTSTGAPRGVSQDCWMSSITKAEWEEVGGVKELVTRQMAREV